jgi:hypothetical protein
MATKQINKYTFKKEMDRGNIDMMMINTVFKQ